MLVYVVDRRALIQWSCCRFNFKSSFRFKVNKQGALIPLRVFNEVTLVHGSFLKVVY